MEKKTYVERITELNKIAGYSIDRSTASDNKFKREDYGDCPNVKIVSARRFPENSNYWYQLIFNELAIVTQERKYTGQRGRFIVVEEPYVVNPYCVFMEIFYNKNDDEVVVNFDTILPTTGNDIFNPNQFAIEAQLVFNEEETPIIIRANNWKNDGKYEINMDHMFESETDSLQIRLSNVSENYPELKALMDEAYNDGNGDKEFSVRANIRFAINKQGYNIKEEE